MSADLEANKGEVKESKRVKITSFNFFARQLWLYFIPLLGRGWRGAIDEASGLELPPQLLMDDGARDAEAIWAAAKTQDAGKRSLARTFLWTQWTVVARGCGIAVLNGFLNSFIRPVILRECIASLSEPLEGNLERSLLLWALLFVVSLLEAWSASAGMVVCCDEALTAFVVFTSRLMCLKSLRAAPSEQARRVTSLFGNDVVRAYETSRAIGYLPLGTAAVTGGVVMLSITIGPAALGGIACMTAILWVTQRIAALTAVQTRRSLEASSNRLAILEQIVESSKAVKLFSWEESYLDLLSKSREVELQHIQRLRWYLVASIQVGRVSPILSSAVTIVCMVLIGDELRAADIFATIAVFMALRLALIVLPQGWASLKMVMVSCVRIQQYLDLPDTEPRETLPAGAEVAVDLVDVGLAWPEHGKKESADGPAFVVQGSLRVERGTAVAIVGPVGCGKSTLLSSLVGQLPPARGTARCSEALAYAPQQPQVICGTVLENVLLGRPYDEEAFHRAIKAADLVHDLQILPGGLQAEIGERGVSLSGGQKQRISIARTLYGVADTALLVLDDPIAAVDPRVGKHLVEQVIVAHRARGGTVVVALNQAGYLHHFDRVVAVKDGQLVEQPVPSAPRRAAQPGAEAEAEAETAAATKEAAAKSLRQTVHAVGEKVILTELSRKGAVSNSVFITFVRSAGYPAVAIFLLVAASGYTCMSAADLWLASWTRARGLSTQQHVDRLLVYLGFVLGFAVLILVSSRLAVLATTNASRSLHRETSTRLLKAPLSWWDGTPKGRITSRFSTDLAQVDTQLGFMCDNLVQLGMNILALCTIISIVTPPMVSLIVLCFAVFGCFFRVVDRTNGVLKRFAHQAMAPLLSNVSEGMQMQHTARLMGVQHFFIARNDLNTDAYNRMNFGSSVLMQFMKFVAVSIAAFITAGTTAWLMFLSRGDPEKAAVAMTYAITVPYFMGMGTQVLGVVKLMLTGLERLLEYKDLPQEPTWHKEDDPAVASWPSLGQLDFQHVKLRYGPNLPWALNDVSFSVPAQARVGVVGRTGSGKSTLVGCLFRLHETQEGVVLLDGVNVLKIGLRCLRRCLTVVPQDPVLMAGTVSQNLDPFGKSSHHDLCRAVQLAEMASTEAEAEEVLKRQLDSGGSNLSCGERQLLCLARAAINGPTVLVMDEPTSSTDPDTDAKIQEMVRSSFRCTTLCIAHRVPTIMDSDLVLVMGDGKVQEFDTPMALYKNPKGHFRSMCDLSDISVEKGALIHRTHSRFSARGLSRSLSGSGSPSGSPGGCFPPIACLGSLAKPPSPKAAQPPRGTSL